MAELEVIYDPAKELACIVNVDERVGWGPAMIGPEAGVILQAFIDTTPFDVSDMDTYTVARAFNGFLDRLAARQETQTTAPDQVQVGSSDGSGVALPAVPTAARGAPTDEPPAAGPADTDAPMEADTGEADTVIQHPMSGIRSEVAQPITTTQQTCGMCGGLGTVQTDPGEPAQQCGLCNGSGQVTVTVPA